MIKKIKALLGYVEAPDASSDELLSAGQQAMALLREAESGLKRAQVAYNAGLLNPDDAHIRRLAEARTDAEIALDRARALAHAIERNHAAAVQREVQADRLRAYEAAKRQASEVHEAIREMYPRVQETMGDMLKALAEAEAAVTSANANLPDGVLPLHGVEVSLRAQPMVLPELISEETVELWCRSGSTRADEIDQEQVEVHNGRGMLRHRTGGTEYLVARSFNKRTMTGIVQGFMPDRLAKAVKLPKLIHIVMKPADTVEYKFIGELDRESDARQTASLADKLSGRA